MLGLIGNNGEQYIVNNSATYTVVILSLVITIGFYLLRSFGLFVLAKKNDDKNISKVAFISFIPFIWVYVAAKLAGRISLFGSEIKSYALILTLIVFVGNVAILVSNLISYLPLAVYFLNGGRIFLNTAENYIPSGLIPYVYNNGILLDSNVLVSYSIALDNVLGILNSIARILSFISRIMLIFVYIALFRKYWPLHSTGACILSIIGFFPIMVFLIRKKEPIDYEKFMRERYQRMYGGNFNNFNGYNQNNYNRNNFDNGSNNSNNTNSDPFENFSNNSNNNNSNDDPFDEFNGSDNN